MISEHKVTDNIVVERVTHSNSENCPANDSIDIQFDVAKTGYTPVGIVGWSYNPFYFDITRTTWTYSAQYPDFNVRFVNRGTSASYLTNLELYVLYIKN